MSGKAFFLDTNILIYTFGHTAIRKQEIATELLEDAIRGKGCISYQVIQEFLNVASRRLSPPLTETQSQQYLKTVLAPLCEFYPDSDFFRRGLDIKERWRFSWYDSLIITAALECGCETLYSEDLQHKQKIESLTVINPFAE